MLFAVGRVRSPKTLIDERLATHAARRLTVSSLCYFFRNIEIKSIGNGKIVVEFFSAAISVSVCK